MLITHALDGSSMMLHNVWSGVYAQAERSQSWCAQQLIKQAATDAISCVMVFVMMAHVGLLETLQ